MSEIILEDVSLHYPIYGANTRSFKRTLVDVATGGRLHNKDKKIVVNALQNISFKLNKGDKLGLIGHNGAGKSTLLKVLAGIYEPQQGVIHINGKVSALLDIHVGMQFDANGYDNIKIRSLMMGLSKKEYCEIVPDIVDFTELGNFLSMPVKTYSSGMAMRLAFGMSTATTPDILLLDEVIGTGDASFINKAQRRIENLVTQSNIVIISSHMTDVIRKFCNKVLWLEHGVIKHFGGVDVIDLYLDSVMNPTPKDSVPSEV